MTQMDETIFLGTKGLQALLNRMRSSTISLAPIAMARIDQIYIERVVPMASLEMEGFILLQSTAFFCQ